VVYGASVVITLASVVLVGATPLSLVFPVVIAAGVYWYLLRPSVKATLRHTPTGESVGSPAS
ncbi:MAG: hypothetical protein ABIZ34_03890, partial [Candidatus Limnocylindrales bacterium]